MNEDTNSHRTTTYVVVIIEDGKPDMEVTAKWLFLLPSVIELYKKIYEFELLELTRIMYGKLLVGKIGSHVTSMKQRNHHMDTQNASIS